MKNIDPELYVDIEKFDKDEFKKQKNGNWTPIATIVNYHGTVNLGAHNLWTDAIGSGNIKYTQAYSRLLYLTDKNIASIGTHPPRQDVIYGRPKRKSFAPASEIIVEEIFKTGNKSWSNNRYSEYWPQIARLNTNNAVAFRELMYNPPAGWCNTVEEFVEVLKDITHIRGVCKMRMPSIVLYAKLYNWLMNDQRKQILQNNMYLFDLAWTVGADAQVWINYAAEQPWVQKAGGYRLSNGDTASEEIYGPKYVTCKTFTVVLTVFIGVLLLF